jgi:hypothetical protein
MGLKDGMVVIVAGKLDTRVREQDPENAIGTVWFMTQTDAVVLLANGDFWRGSKKMIYPAQENPAPLA